MSYSVHITKNGIAVFDGIDLINTRNADAVYTLMKNAADETAPIIEGALDTQAFSSLIQSAGNGDINGFTRDSIAGSLA